MITWLLRQRPNLPAKRLSRFGCLDSRRDNRTPLSLLIPQRDMMRTCVREFRPTSCSHPLFLHILVDYEVSYRYAKEGQYRYS